LDDGINLLDDVLFPCFIAS